MERVELTRGQWADLRTAEDISERDRRPVLDILADEEIPSIQRGQRAARALLPWLIASWSLDLPLPRENPDVLNDLRGHDHDRLTRAASDRFSRLFERFEVSDDPNPDGGPSNGSAGGPKADLSAPATSPPPIVTGSSPAGSAGP